MAMEYDTFVGEIRQRHTFSERGPAEHAIDAIATTLGEVLPQEISQVVADLLPEEIAEQLLAPRSEKLNLTRFLDRVARRSGVDQDEALRQAQLVVGLFAELAPDDEIEQMRAYMVPGFDPLFEIADRHLTSRRTGEPGAAEA